jgi:hypothetical protein
MIGLRIYLLIFCCCFGSALAQEARPRPGAGVDAAGNAVIDPTENVKALNEAANKRQDDLRAAEEKLNELRSQHLQEIMTLRTDYENQLRVAEAKRIDAIRLVDTTAVAVQNERAVATATTLAKTVQDSAQVLSVQVTKSADDLRTLVATTAAESSRSLQQQFAAITTRLSALEQGSAEGLGKQKYQDPALASLIEQVSKIAQKQTDSAGINAGRGDVIGWIMAALMFMVALAAVLVSALRPRPGK